LATKTKKLIENVESFRTPKKSACGPRDRMSTKTFETMASSQLDHKRMLATMGHKRAINLGDTDAKGKIQR
jgi:hypothetical protein